MALATRRALSLLASPAVVGLAFCMLLAFPGMARAQSSAPAPNVPSRPVLTPDSPGPAAALPAATASPVSAGAPLSPGIANNWVQLTNLPGFTANTLLLLTDGRVLVQDFANTDWHMLTPDNTGSYINGTWSALGSSPQRCLNTRTQAVETYQPLYFASAVLPDGRVVILGGEYNFAIQSSEIWTNLGEIYDPVANTWTCLAAPSGWNRLGDAMSVVLPDGTFQVGNALGTQVATLDLSHSSPRWTVINPPGKSADSGGYNNEEGWTLLPNGTVLTLEVWNSADTTSTPAVAYSPASQSWISAGTAPDPLVLISKGSTTYREVGPAVLRPDGTVFAAGAKGFNDIYNTTTGAWASGPSFPTFVETVSCNGTTYLNQTEQYVPADGPAALLPDGHVLIEGSPVDTNCKWVSPSAFFEFDGTNLTQVSSTVNSAQNVSFNGRMLSLPTGQILFTDATGDVEVYTATGTPNAAWAPTITNAPLAVGAGGTNNKIAGTQFNGLSQAVAYGDDYQAATNYPLVRITNTASGHVFYARTHGHSTMGVATGSAPVSTYFDVPANIELGSSTLVVVANGIPSASVALTVLKPGTTALVSLTNPSTLGQQVTFTATVTGTGGTPTGSVTFYDGTTTLGTTALSAGAATFATSSLSIGSHSITAQYDGDANFGSTTSTVVTQVVNGSAAIATVVSSLNPSQATQSVTFTATVRSSGSGGTPTGTVTFLDGNTSLDGSTVLLTATLVGVSASVTTTSLSVGLHSITVEYSGDANFNSVTSSAITETVNAIPTATALVSSANPSAGGQSVTFTATVSSSGGTPTGTVTFLDGTTSLATTNFSSSAPGSAVATFTTSSLAIGTHSITAKYNGSSIFAVSTSTALSQVISGLSTSVALSSSPNPSMVGNAATFTATVTGSGGGTPTGTVTFFDGTNTLGPGTLSGNGVAVLVVSSLSAGSHTITASYGGDASFSPSTSAPLTQVVTGLSTTAVLVSSVNPSASGQAVTFTATVTSSGGTPTGTVTFKDGGTSLGTGTLSGNGVASFTTSVLASGSHSITASYGGDSNFAVSTSNTVTQIVLKAASVSLASSLNVLISGQTVTFTATVSGSGGTPTGTVTFKNGGTSLGTGTLNGSGVASFTTSALPLGADSITASYGGDANFGPATSAAVTEIVSLAMVDAVSTGSTVTAGQSVPINLIAYAASGSNLTFTFTCVGAPAKSTCTFSPSPVSPAPPPTGTPIQLTFGTSSSSVPAGPSNRDPWLWGALGILAAFAALWAVKTPQLQFAPRRRLAYGSCLSLMALAMILVGCGPATPTPPPYTGTPKGTATFTVTGSSGGTIIETLVTVTVQ